MKINYEIPTSKEDITLSKWSEYVSIEKKDIDYDFLQSKRLEIFCGLQLEDVLNLPQVNIDEANYDIECVFNDENKFITRFEFKNIEWGLIPDFNKYITTRELIDLDHYLSQKDYIRLLSILYRPVIKTEGNSYLIEPYKETHTLFKDLRYDIFEGCIGFFLRTLNQLGSQTLKFIENNLSETSLNTQEKQRLLENMADIQSFYSYYQTVMLQK